MSIPRKSWDLNHQLPCHYPAPYHCATTTCSFSGKLGRDEVQYIDTYRYEEQMENIENKENQK
ncbi:Uncharacterized protein APZ42_000631 [Daphnia magna]|uniref:Uncharacterized protein n=1 Tax=Daphnia magna TaxID=35525 RepID=A0A164JHM5_9CRUS|nr:Uncharacterized protein APZ42_000631 [Daphnia magna]